MIYWRTFSSPRSNQNLLIKSKVLYIGLSNIILVNMDKLEEIFESENTDLRIKTLSNKFRRFLLGLIYTEGRPMYQSDVLKHVNVKSNLLAYHLKLLTDSGLLYNKFERREGKRFSKYSITLDGIRALEYIGVKSDLDQITSIVNQF